MTHMTYYDIYRLYKDDLDTYRGMMTDSREFMDECREHMAGEGRPDLYGAYAAYLLMYKMGTLLDIIDDLQEQKERLLKELGQVS